MTQILEIIIQRVKFKKTFWNNVGRIFFIRDKEFTDLMSLISSNNLSRPTSSNRLHCFEIRISVFRTLLRF